MLDDVEGLFVADAQRAQGKHPRGIVAEMNDPFRTSLLDDSMDPFDRALLLHGWGFRLLDLPYVQPLSALQGPVEYPDADRQAAAAPLRGLAGRRRARPDPRLPDLRHAVRRSRDQPAFRHYGALALGPHVSPPPLACGHCRQRTRHSLDRSTRPATSVFDDAMRLYHSTFEGDTSIGDEDFAVFLDARSSAGLRYAYHFWVAQSPVGNEVHGFASFFTFAHCGFGGYTVRRRTPRPDPQIPFAVGIASVEERMRRDNPAIEGWFIECDPREKKQPASIFDPYGFREVAIDMPTAPPGLAIRIQGRRGVEPALQALR